MSRALDRIEVVEDLTSKTSQQLQTVDAESLKRTTNLLALQNIEASPAVPADPETNTEAIPAVLPVDGVFNVYACSVIPATSPPQFLCQQNGVNVPFLNGLYVFKATINYDWAFHGGMTPIPITFTSYFCPSDISVVGYTSVAITNYPQQIVFKIYAFMDGNNIKVILTSKGYSNHTVTNAVITQLDILTLREPTVGTQKLIPHDVSIEIEKYHVSKALNDSLRYKVIVPNYNTTLT
jgi:hypothetical protein